MHNSSIDNEETNHTVCRFVLFFLLLLFGNNILAQEADLCGSAPLHCNSLHNAEVTVNTDITGIESAIIKIRFKQYANSNASIGSMLFDPQVYASLGGEFLGLMQLTDIDYLVGPSIYTYRIGNIPYTFILELVEYEYTFEWNLTDAQGLPAQLFSAITVNVNAGAKEFTRSQNLVNGFENQLGPLDCNDGTGIGNQCNTKNGNFYYTQTDYTGNSGLFFKRHYNSLQQVSSAVTSGSWTTTGSSKIIDFSFFINGESSGSPNDRELYLYLDEYGRYDYFSRSDDSSPFEVDADIEYSFEKLADNSFIVTMSDGSFYLYGSDGLLDLHTDASGNQTSYSHQASGKLAQISDVYGNSLNLTYTGNDIALTLPDGNVINYQQPDNQISQVTWPDGRTENYSYDGNGFLASARKNDSQLIIENTYDSSGRVLSHSDEVSGKAWTFEYSLETRVSEVTTTNAMSNRLLAINPDNQMQNSATEASKLSDLQLVVTYTDEDGNSAQRTSAFDDDQLLVTDYSHLTGDDNYLNTFDNNGNLTSTTDPEGNRTDFVYNRFDQLLSQTDGTGSDVSRNTSYAYLSDTLDYPTRITRPSVLISATQSYQHIAQLTYNAQNRVTQMTETGYALDETELSRTTSYTYDSQGKVLTVDGPRNDVTDVLTMTYNNCNTGAGCGLVASVSNALGETTLFEEYDTAGRVGKVTYANGLVNEMLYDSAGNVLSLTETADGVSRISEYTYTKGLLSSMTMPGGETVSFGYDAQQNLNQITDSLGNTQSYQYDANDNVIAESLEDAEDLIQYQVTRNFDRLDQLNTLTNINGITDYDFDKTGRLSQVMDALNEIDDYQYDALSRLTQHTDALSNVTTYEYDNHDHLTQVTDAAGNITTYNYDDFGRMTSQVSPATGSSAYTYDEADNVLTHSDARAVQVSYQYDALNRVTNITYTDPAENISFTYNNAGLLATVTHQSGTETYSYNGFNELIQATSTIADQTYTVQYQYNANGQPVSITYPNGDALTYEYLNNRVVNVALEQDGVIQTLAQNIQYLPFGPVSAMDYGNGKSLEQQFNQSYQLSDKSVTGVLDNLYTYSPVDNITSIQDSENDSPQQFSYDANDRLTDATGIYGDIDFSYDATGNRLTKTVDGATDTYSYSNGTLLDDVTGDHNFAMTYDVMGNLLSKGSDSYSYNLAGRLSSATVNSDTTTYQYNHAGQRIFKQFQNAEQRHYIYDPAGMLLGEYTGDGELVMQYFYLNGERLALVPGATQTSSEPVIIDDSAALFSDDWEAKSHRRSYNGDHHRIKADIIADNGVILDDNYVVLSGEWELVANGKGYNGSDFYKHQPNQLVPGNILDNADASVMGEWKNKTHRKAINDDFLVAEAGTGESTVSWNLDTVQYGEYLLYTRWKAGKKRATDAPMIISHAFGSDTVLLNQTENGNQWQLAGTYTLDAASQVTISNEANGKVAADAIMWVSTAAPANNAQWQWTADESTEYNLYATWKGGKKRASNATYTISTDNPVSPAEQMVTVNQQENGKTWQILSTVAVEAGDTITITLTDQADGIVVADAIQIVPTDEAYGQAVWDLNGYNLQGAYDVQVTWKSGNKRATDAPYMVSHAGGETLVEADQTQNLDWLSLGIFNLNDNSQIKLTNNADGVVIADAIQFIPQASNSSGRVYYTHTNHLDAPVALSDDSGTVVWQASYTPFGKMTVLVDTLGTDITPRFPGQYADAQTGFYYNYFRDYDPEIGRYVQSDPLGMVDGPNTYQYALSNPSNFTDPTGEFAWPAVGFLGNAAYQWYKTGSFDCINWWEAASWGLGGAGAKILANSAKLHGGVGKAIARFFKENRKFYGHNGVSRSYWQMNGPANGRSLHHLWKTNAHGGSNAGFNLLNLPAFKGLFHRSLDLNRWMGFAQRWGGQHAINAARTEKAIRGIVAGSAAGAFALGYNLGLKATEEKCGCQ